MKEIRDSLQDLAEQFKEDGDNIVFNKIYSILHLRFLIYVKKTLKDTGLNYCELDVDDIIANTFSKMFFNIDQYDTLYNFSTWSYTILKNETLKFMHEKNKENVFFGITFFADKYIDNEINHYCPVKDSPLFELSSAYRAHESHWIVNPKFGEDNDLFENLITNIKEEIYKLEPKYKNILVDREIHNMSYSQLCNKYKLKMGTVKTHIHKGRQLLHSRLNDKYLEWLESLK